MYLLDWQRIQNIKYQLINVIYKEFIWSLKELRIPSYLIMGKDGPGKFYCSNIWLYKFLSALEYKIKTQAIPPAHVLHMLVESDSFNYMTHQATKFPNVLPMHISQHTHTHTDTHACTDAYIFSPIHIFLWSSYIFSEPFAIIIVVILL